MNALVKCLQKSRFVNVKVAQAWIKAHRWRFDGPVRAYYCHGCQGAHFTTPRRKG